MSLSSCPMEAKTRGGEQQSHHYANLHNLCYAYFDYTIYTTMFRWWLQHLSSSFTLDIALDGCEFEKCIRLNNTEQLTACLQVLQEYNYTLVDICSHFQHYLDSGKRLHISIVDFCQPNISLSCPITQSFASDTDAYSSCYYADNDDVLENDDFDHVWQRNVA